MARKISFFIFPAVLCYSVLPSFLLKFFQTVKRKMKNSEKVLYLTFDDGPGDDTESLLRLLREYRIPASFFVVSEFAVRYPDIIKELKTDGHLIGIHSVKHQNALFRGSRFVRTDLMRALLSMQKLNCRIKFYRPPWGHLNLFSLYWVKRLGLHLMFWDVMAEDWSAKETSDSIEKKLMKRVFPGAVICLHDGRGSDGAPRRTIEALKRVLPKLISQGYQFRKLGQYE